MTVRELVFEYTTKGATAAQRADESVRSSVRQTGREANRQSNRVERWMTANRTAIQRIGTAAAGAMGAILAASPTLRAQLSGVRTSFTLLSDTIVRDVLPNSNSLAGTTVELATSYSDLDDEIREPTSKLIAFGGAAAVAVRFVNPIAGVLIAAVGAFSALNSVLPKSISLLAPVGILAAALLVTVGPLAAGIMAVAGGLTILAGWLWRNRDAIISFISDGVNWAIDRLDTLWGWLTDIGAWVKGGIGNAWDWFTDRVSDAKGLVGDLWNLLKNVGGWTTDKIGGAWSWFTDAASNAKDRVTDIWDTLTDIAGRKWDTAIEIIVEIAETITEGARSAGSRLDPRGTRLDPREFSIPGSATGGEVQRGGYAYLHAGNEVSPAAQIDRGGTERNGGVNVDNIEINIMSSGNARRDGRNAAQEVAQEFQRELGGRGVNR